MARLPKILTDHLMEPRNPGVLEDQTAVQGRGENPACGDVLVIYLKLDAERRLDVRFQARGCSAVIAVGSLVAEAVVGMTIGDAMALPIQELVDRAGGLDRMQSHAVRVSKRALDMALAQLV